MVRKSLVKTSLGLIETVIDLIDHDDVFEIETINTKLIEVVSGLTQAIDPLNRSPNLWRKIYSMPPPPTDRLWRD